MHSTTEPSRWNVVEGVAQCLAHGHGGDLCLHVHPVDSGSAYELAYLIRPQARMQMRFNTAFPPPEYPITAHISATIASLCIEPHMPETMRWFITRSADRLFGDEPGLGGQPSGSDITGREPGLGSREPQ